MGMASELRLTSDSVGVPGLRPGEEGKMKFVVMVYQGSTPLPGSDRWHTLSEGEQKAIYADYAELNRTEGVTAGLPLGLPDAARTVQVRDGKTYVRTGT